jgi:membrane-associated phospholipid phosphatase
MDRHRDRSRPTGSTWHERFRLGLLLAVVFPVAFFGSAHLMAGRIIPTPSWLRTPLDDSLDVVPAAVWLYLSWYVMPIVLFSRESDALRDGVAAMLVALAVCVLGYVLLPITIDRPALRGDATTFAVDAVRGLYRFDPATNLFPSLHAAVAVIIGRVVRFDERWASIGMKIWSGAVCVSCVLVRQHYVLDVVAGASVGFAALGAVRISASGMAGETFRRIAGRNDPLPER